MGWLKRLERRRFFKPNPQEQGYALRIDKNPFDTGGKTWLAALCGADPHGTLYAVRDFCHYHLQKDKVDIVLRSARISIAPRIKNRIVADAGYNIFSSSTMKSTTRYPSTAPVGTLSIAMWFSTSNITWTG